jgi:hypothetical protein
MSFEELDANLILGGVLGVHHHVRVDEVEVGGQQLLHLLAEVLGDKLERRSGAVQIVTSRVKNLHRKVKLVIQVKHVQI